MSATFFDAVREKVAFANAKVSTPATFLDVNAIETRDVGAGTITRTGGETITVQVFPPGMADRRSIEAGYAAEGQQVLPVRAEVLVRSGGVLFEPVIGGQVRVHGTTWAIERVSVIRDDAGAAIVFFLALRA